MRTITRATLERLNRALPYMAPAEKRAALLLLEEPTKEPESFVEFTHRVNPQFVFHPHNYTVAEVLQQVADDKLFRVMVFEPPRHGKSEQISRLFPGYYLYRHPERWVGLTAYGAELAFTYSRAARTNWQRATGGPVDEATSAIKHWETGEGGGLWAAGIGGPIAGKGFSLGIIDDPVKNAAEAKSARKQLAHREWFDSVFYTRQAPNAAIVVTLTRWDQKDLAGYVLQKETEGDEPERWHIVHLAAVREEQFPPQDVDGRPMYPVTCTLEPDHRKPGQPLAPNRYGLKALLKIKARITTYFWNALYQQRPTPPEGTMLKREWFRKIVDIPGKVIARARWWDNASSDGSGDYTAGVLVAKYVTKGTKQVRYVIEDVARGQWSPGKRKEMKREVADRDGALKPRPAIWEEQEPGSAGKEVALQAKLDLVEYGVRTEPSTGDKPTALLPLAVAAELGTVDILDRPWTNAWLAEAASFPHGEFDDQVEAAGKAFSKVAPAVDMDPGAYTGSRK